ncbi:MAG: hypothetical protein Q9199_006270 [Rusavskia elegans]
MKSKPFDLSKDIPDLQSKVFLDTGAAAGVVTQAKSPPINITFLDCDHTSLASVQKVMRKFISESQRLDILFCNAGVMEIDPTLTEDGYEQQFGINQMAHALMIKMLLPTLQSTAQKTADVRIIFHSSVGFRWSGHRPEAFALMSRKAISVHNGARTPRWAMTTSKASLSNGAFYEKVGVTSSPSKDSSDKNLGEKLWDWTDHELEKYGKCLGEKI